MLALRFARRPDLPPPPPQQPVWQSPPAARYPAQVWQQAGLALCAELTPCPHSGRCLLGWLRLDNRASLAAKLGLAADRHSDGELLLAAYQRWQQHCLAELEGDFAFALYDPQRQQVLLGRDALGHRPLYYLLDSQQLLVSTTPPILTRAAGAALQPDPAWIARFLLNQSQSQQHTAFTALHKLPPGHWALVTPQHCTLHDYRQWTLDHATTTDTDWVAAYRHQLEQAVARRLPAAGAIGCENSGGIDSAALTGIGAVQAGADRMYCLASAVLEDEPGLILATSQLHGIAHNYLSARQYELSDEDIRGALAVMSYPVEHGNASLHLPFYRLCQQLGIGTLLSGFGGDEAVSYSGALCYPELLAQRQWHALWSRLPGGVVPRSLRLARLLWRQQAQPAPQSNLGYHPLRREVLADPALQQLTPWPTSLPCQQPSLNTHVLYERLYAPYVATRLENGALLAASHGVQYQWPLLDQQLIQQYLSTPTPEKRGPNGVSRYLHRRAIAGYVPPQVQWRPSKDMGITQRLRQTVWAQRSAQLQRTLQDTLAALDPALQALVDSEGLLARMAQLRHTDMARQPIPLLQIEQIQQRLRWLNAWLHHKPWQA